jgi:DNA-binding Lrp family transcriptional regulator
MPRQLDSIDVRILEALGVYGPRNISKIARDLSMPAETVRDRVKQLKLHFSLYFQANVYHTFLGLKKAFVFAKATPGNESVLQDCLKANNYWLYLSSCYGRAESFYGIYGIPIDNTLEFKRFIEEIQKLGIADNTDISWSTCLHTSNLNGSWFDHKLDKWVFRWDEWIKSIETQGTELPKTLVEPDGYPQKADKIDIILLKELDKDGTKKLRDIAEMLNVRPQVIQYHYKNHIIGKELIEGFAVFLPSLYEVSDIFCFRFNFYNKKVMAKFALSLQGKPFVLSMGKIFGENSLFAQIYLPRQEYRPFVDSLLKLMRNNILKSYDYIVEDQSKKQLQTISYEHFRDRMWIYDHEAHLKKVRQLAKQKL